MAVQWRWGRKGGRLNARADAWGQRGEEHRAPRAGAGNSRSPFADRIWCHFTDQKQTSRREQAPTATEPEPVQPRNTTDTPQLQQAMSEEEKYEGAQGDHNARMFFENPPALPETETFHELV
jgi:hypothetical protein